MKPKFRTFKESDDMLLEFSLNMNMDRRHLTESQRAMIAARMTGRGSGFRSDLHKFVQVTRDQAVSRCRTSRAFAFFTRVLLDTRARFRFNRDAERFTCLLILEFWEYLCFLASAMVTMEAVPKTDLTHSVGH